MAHHFFFKQPPMKQQPLVMKAWGCQATVSRTYCLVALRERICLKLVGLRTLYYGQHITREGQLDHMQRCFFLAIRRNVSGTYWRNTWFLKIHACVAVAWMLRMFGVLRVLGCYHTHASFRWNQRSLCILLLNMQRKLASHLLHTEKFKCFITKAI